MCTATSQLCEYPSEVVSLTHLETICSQKGIKAMKGHVLYRLVIACNSTGILHVENWMHTTVCSLL